MNTEKSNLTKTLLRNIFDDFKSFFIKSNDADFVKYQIQDQLSNPMLVRKIGNNAYIAISDEILNMDLETDEDKLFVLFMIGHELAHLANKHLYYREIKNLDSKTIEMWADFFGAKISMSIFQDGNKFNKMLKKDFKNVNIGIEALGNVLKNLHTKIYLNTNSSSKYLNSHNRFSSTVGGIAAYLTRKDMVLTRRFSTEEHADIGCDWGISFNRKLLELGVFDELFDKGNKFIEQNENEIRLRELGENAFKIHKSLQLDSSRLLKGLNPLHDYILYTSYDKYEVNQLMTEKFNNHLGINTWNMTTSGNT